VLNQINSILSQFTCPNKVEIGIFSMDLRMRFPRYGLLRNHKINPEGSHFRLK
jgi:hypothetical protein